MGLALWQAIVSEKQWDELGELARQQIADDLQIYFDQLIEDRIN